MEALNIFFKEVNKITNEYSQKEKCEMPSVFNQAKENKDFIELTEKIKAGSEIQISDIERFAEKLVIPDSIAKAFEAISPQDLFSIFMLPDVGFELENECISLLRNKLFSLSPIDRDIYAGIFAREFDSKLYCEFDVIDYIYENLEIIMIFVLRNTQRSQLQRKRKHPKMLQKQRKKIGSRKILLPTLTLTAIKRKNGSIRVCSATQ